MPNLRALLRPICWIIGHREDDADMGVCLCERCGAFLWVMRGG